MRKKWIILAPLALLAIPLFIWIGGELVMHLWNWLLPSLFGWRQITFWQAVGLLALCRILFGGVSGRGLHRSNIRRRIDERIGRRMDERWEQMTRRLWSANQRNPNKRNQGVGLIVPRWRFAMAGRVEHPYAIRPPWVLHPYSSREAPFCRLPSV